MKTACIFLLNIALLLTNAAHLKHLLIIGESHRFYGIMLALLILSYILQFIIGASLLYLGGRIDISSNHLEEDSHMIGLIRKRANRINTWVTFGVIILTGLIVILAAFALNAE